MIFPIGHSGLVRLSDCLKFAVGNCTDTAAEIISHHQRSADVLEELRAIAKKQLDDNDFSDDSQRKLQAASALIPLEEARTVASLQYRLHSEVLTVVLSSCFTLESYINSLGFFLLRERDIVGLVRNSTASAAEAFLEAIDRMSTLAKWQTLGKLKSESGFDTSTPPFQDVKILFKFRDDHVHDKVIDWDSEQSERRYNNKFPNPLDLLVPSHAVYACNTYWGMILKIHDLVGIPPSEFHRHYNLKPWFDEGFEERAKSTAAEYDRVTRIAPKR